MTIKDLALQPSRLDRHVHQLPTGAITARAVTDTRKTPGRRSGRAWTPHAPGPLDDPVLEQP